METLVTTVPLVEDICHDEQRGDSKDYSHQASSDDVVGMVEVVADPAAWG